jgi:hypothetical protein
MAAEHALCADRAAVFQDFEHVFDELAHDGVRDGIFGPVATAGRVRSPSSE